ncbi:unnamed protein product [Miscanthus lutarioriparius]|uniref:Uncharacterized protein n=1 Tax=Miscanthus lutarioriparius TaxID=422564 RepID=A0A811RKP1_9POAL|nr:unnamed protein product [Miscanthus lutarioriparius]
MSAAGAPNTSGRMQKEGRAGPATSGEPQREGRSRAHGWRESSRRDRRRGGGGLPCRHNRCWGRSPTTSGQMQNKRRSGRVAESENFLCRRPPQLRPPSVAGCASASNAGFVGPYALSEQKGKEAALGVLAATLDEGRGCAGPAHRGPVAS